MSSLSLSKNSGSVEMWKYIVIILIYLITLEVWKCGNMSSMSLSNNSNNLPGDHDKDRIKKSIEPLLAAWGLTM